MQAAENAPVAKKPEKRLTYADYVALTPPDSGNYELHDGKIIYMASPTPLHQRVVRRLFRRMDAFAEMHELGEVFFAPLDTVFGDINTFQPDILFISRERRNIIGDKKIDGAPDLVVEVLSEGNKPMEMSYKKHIYESHQVQEYWLVSLKKNTVTLYRNTDGELMPTGIFRNDNELVSQILPGFRIRVCDILQES